MSMSASSAVTQGLNITPCRPAPSMTARSPPMLEMSFVIQGDSRSFLSRRFIQRALGIPALRSGRRPISAARAASGTRPRQGVVRGAPAAGAGPQCPQPGPARPDDDESLPASLTSRTAGGPTNEAALNGPTWAARRPGSACMFPAGPVEGITTRQRASPASASARGGTIARTPLERIPERHVNSVDASCGSAATWVHGLAPTGHLAPGWVRPRLDRQGGSSWATTDQVARAAARSARAARSRGTRSSARGAPWPGLSRGRPCDGHMQPSRPWQVHPCHVPRERREAARPRAAARCRRVP